MQKPVRNADLWRRVDHALQFHELQCRMLPSAAKQDSCVGDFDHESESSTSLAGESLVESMIAGQNRWTEPHLQAAAFSATTQSVPTAAVMTGHSPDAGQLSPNARREFRGPNAAPVVAAGVADQDHRPSGMFASPGALSVKTAVWKLPKSIAARTAAAAAAFLAPQQPAYFQGA